MEEYRKLAPLKEAIQDSKYINYVIHLIRDVKAGVMNRGHYAHDARAYLFVKKYKPATIYGPGFELCHYRELCKALSEDPHSRFIDMEQYIDGDIERNSINISLRHDIDKRDCIDNARMLVDVELEYGLKSSLYIICDGSGYRPEDAVEMVSELKGVGCHIGLHTLAHGSAEPMGYLINEIMVFEKYFGFRPKTYVMHGINPRPYDYRKRLKRFKRMSRLIEGELGIKGHVSLGLGERKFTERRVCINGEYKNEISVPTREFRRSLFLGSHVMVITHPWLWQRNADQGL